MYDDTFDALYSYILWRCGGQHDQADEVAQETWLTAVRKVRRFDPNKGTFSAWLCGLARNALRHQLRLRHRLRNREQAAKIINTTKARRSQPPEDDRIAVALDVLSQRHEAVLRTKYLDGLRVEEIAARWNETPKTVESLLSRACQTFRELFEKQEILIMCGPNDFDDDSIAAVLARAGDRLTTLKSARRCSRKRSA